MLYLWVKVHARPRHARFPALTITLVPVAKPLPVDDLLTHRVVCGRVCTMVMATHQPVARSAVAGSCLPRNPGGTIVPFNRVKRSLRWSVATRLDLLRWSVRQGCGWHPRAVARATARLLFLNRATRHFHAGQSKVFAGLTSRWIID